MGKKFDCIWIPLVISGLVFLVSWAIAGICFYVNFELTTELGTYSELTLPKGMQTRYAMLAAQFGAIVAGYIALVIFIIVFLICLISV